MKGKKPAGLRRRGPRGARSWASPGTRRPRPLFSVILLFQSAVGLSVLLFFFTAGFCLSRNSIHLSMFLPGYSLTYLPHEAVSELSNHEEPIGRGCLEFNWFESPLMSDPNELKIKGCGCHLI